MVAFFFFSEKNQHERHFREAYPFSDVLFFDERGRRRKSRASQDKNFDLIWQSDQISDFRISNLSYYNFMINKKKSDI